MDLLRVLVLAAHALLGAVWLGAMVYSLVVLHPRAMRFFGRDEQFEPFVATLAQGARWKVLGIVGAIATTGLVLLALPHHQTRAPIWLLITKATLLLLATGAFAYVSWSLWPRRIFAIGDEVGACQRRFRLIGAALIALSAPPSC